VGGSKSYPVLNLIKLIEKNLNLKAKIILRSSRGEMKATRANANKLLKLIKFKPTTNLKKGVSNFIRWYLGFKSKK
jgi:UDP-glucuronate 4-epimerase